MEENVKFDNSYLLNILSKTDESDLSDEGRGEILQYLGKNIQHLCADDSVAIEKIALQVFEEAPVHQKHQIRFYCSVLKELDAQKEIGQSWSSCHSWLQGLVAGSKEAKDDLNSNNDERVVTPLIAPVLLHIAKDLSAQAQGRLFSKVFAELYGENVQGRLFAGLFALAGEPLRKELFQATILATGLPNWIVVEAACESMKGDDLLRLELAQQCAQNSPSKTIENVSCFQIDDPLNRLQLGKDCALLDPFNMAGGIKGFNLDDEPHRFVLAKLCAVGNGATTADNIANFKLSEPSRAKIAKLCLLQNGLGASFLITNFDIKEQQALIMLAECCAETSRGMLALNIGAFAIESPEDRVRIAMICARNGGGKTAQHIENFKINNRPNDLFEIACQCAQSDGLGTAQFIANFGIDPVKGSKWLVEIARLCAQQDGSGTARYIKNFNLEAQWVRVSLAKICAKSDGATAEHIGNFEIENQAQLIEIFRLCAQENGELAVQHIDKFGIKDKDEQRELGMFALKKAPAALSYLGKCGFEEELGKLPTLRKALRGDLFEGRKLLQDYISRLKEVDFEEAIESVASDKLLNLGDENVQENELRQGLILWMGASLFLLCTELSDDELSWIEEKDLLTAIATLRRPKLREPLLRCLISAAQNAQDDYASLTPPKKKQRSRKLINLLTANFVCQGGNAKDITVLVSVMKRSDPRYGEALIELLVRLRDTDQLDDNEKMLALQQLVNEAREAVNNKGNKSTREEFLILIKIANALLLFQKETALIDKDVSLTSSLKNVFKEVIGIGNIGDFASKYAATFGNSRNPQAIMIYASKMATLNDQKVNTCLSIFATSVLLRNFKDERYRLDNNPHLKVIFENSGSMLKKWKQPISCLLSELVRSQEQTEINPASWLEQALSSGKHKGLKKMTYLQDLQNASSQEEIDKLQESLLAERQKIRKEIRGKREKNTDAKQDLYRINLEAAFFELTSASISQQQRAVMEIIDIIKKNPQFKISGMLKELESMGALLKKAASSKSLSVFETDDPMDLLLCGTEVFGSCQRIDGNPAINKALLGYLMNGSTRVLKLAEGPDSPFVARSLLRLLWDGKQAVLFRDRFYPKKISKVHKEALNSMAKRKAAELGVPLVSLDEGGVAHGQPLRALGGSAPFDYSDGSGGLNVGGKYMIVGARYLQRALS